MFTIKKRQGRTDAKTNSFRHSNICSGLRSCRGSSRSSHSLQKLKLGKSKGRTFFAGAHFLAVVFLAAVSVFALGLPEPIPSLANAFAITASVVKAAVFFSAGAVVVVVEGFAALGLEEALEEGLF